MSACFSRSVVLSTCVLLFAGCGAPSGGSDGGGGADGGGAVTCGDVTCGAGEVCCDASCGLCAAAGSCGGVECADAGTDAGAPDEDASVACGTETCAPGELCCPGCDGAMSCEAGPSCPDVSCAPTCSPSEPCAEAEYCEMPGGACGTGTCKPRPTGCPRDCPRVCGCDGIEYCNACLAHAGGTDVATGVTCATPPCVAMDARDDGGSCPGTLGFAFDGTRCVGIHCACSGEDCDALYPTSEDCEAAYSHCLGGGTTCGGFIGATCAHGEWCDYPADALCGAADGSGT